tara:strand:+ start:2001 stop:3392 length:1392 start_codon:yes stop_codon:yes gene_type:complete
MRRNSGIIGKEQTPSLTDAPGIHDLFDHYNCKLDSAWPIVPSVTSFSSNRGTNLDEEVSATFTVNTEGFADGDTLYYSIVTVSGTTLIGDDFYSGSLTGSFTLNASGVGQFNITPKGDDISESNTCKVQIRRDSVSGDILAETATLTMSDAAIPAGPPGSTSNSQAFSFTGSVQTFTIPSGVNWLKVTANGGGGGRAQGNTSAGDGGQIVGWISVSSLSSVSVIVGEGGDGNDNASGNRYGAGGGGFSGILDGNIHLISAGGGGGGQNNLPISPSGTILDSDGGHTQVNSSTSAAGGLGGEGDSTAVAFTLDDGANGGSTGGGAGGATSTGSGAATNDTGGGGGGGGYGTAGGAGGFGRGSGQADYIGGDGGFGGGGGGGGGGWGGQTQRTNPGSGGGGGYIGGQGGLNNTTYYHRNGQGGWNFITDEGSGGSYLISSTSGGGANGGASSGDKGSNGSVTVEW